MATRSRTTTSRQRTSSRQPAASPRAPKPKASQAPPAPPADKPRGMVPRADGSQLRRATVYLSPPLAKRLALFAADHDLDKSGVMVRALEAYLDAQKA